MHLLECFIFSQNAVDSQVLSILSFDEVKNGLTRGKGEEKTSGKLIFFHFYFLEKAFKIFTPLYFIFSPNVCIETFFLTLCIRKYLLKEAFARGEGGRWCTNIKRIWRSEEFKIFALGNLSDLLGVEEYRWVQYCRGIFIEQCPLFLRDMKREIRRNS